MRAALGPCRESARRRGSRLQSPPAPVFSELQKVEVKILSSCRPEMNKMTPQSPRVQGTISILRTRLLQLRPRRVRTSAFEVLAGPWPVLGPVGPSRHARLETLRFSAAQRTSSSRECGPRRLAPKPRAASPSREPRPGLQASATRPGTLRGSSPAPSFSFAFDSVHEGFRC